MQRVSGANFLANGNGVGKAAYQDYNSATGQVGTTPNAAALNALQEEIAGVIEWQGLQLNANDNTQLQQAIVKYVTAQLGTYETAAAATAALASAVANLESPAQVASAISAALASYATQASLTAYATQTSLTALATATAGTYMPLVGGTFTGPISGLTPAQFDTSTKLATMAALQRALGNFSTVIDTVATTLTLTASQAGAVVYSSASTAQTINLPAPTAVPAGASFLVVSASGSLITINTPAANFYGSVYTGNGTAATTLQPLQTLKLISDGVNWLGFGAPLSGITPSVGDNSIKLATTAFVYNNTLGHGQAWSDVTSSRAANTTYTNTYGRPIQLRIVCSNTSGSSANLILNGTLNMLLSTSSVSYYAYQVADIIIPAGATYSVTSGANIQQWLQLS